MQTRHIALISFIALRLSGQAIPTPVQRYNEVTKNCSNNSCQKAAEEAAADIIETLLELPTQAIAEQILPAATVDTNEARRVALKLLPDRQLGASSGVGGGTGLASLSAVSELIAGAMESGAFQRNTSGTVSTIRANAVGAYRLFTGDCPKGSIQAYPACVTEDRSSWRGLSVGFTFDSSRNDQAAPGNAADPTKSINALFLRARRGLAAASVRYEFLKRADLTNTGAKEVWKANLGNLSKSGADYAKAVADGPAMVTVRTLQEGLPARLHAHLAPLPEGERQAAAEKFVTDFVIAKGLNVPREKWEAYQAARTAHLKSEVEFFRTTLDRNLFTAEFTHQRPKDEPEYGGLTFIYADTVGKHDEAISIDGASTTVTVPNWNLTFNLGVNFFYEKQNIQSKRTLRDFHAAFQADRKLWRWKFLNMPTFTLAGYYQRLTDDSVLSFNSDAIVPGTGIALPKPANVILKGTKGDVGIAQAKLTIPFRDSGVSFPMALTWSNRTELLRIPGNDVRGHFGLLFDMDKLLTAVKGKAK